MKYPPSKKKPQIVAPKTNKNKNANGPECLLHLLIGCMKILMLKLFVIIFGLGQCHVQKLGDISEIRSKVTQSSPCLWAYFRDLTTLSVVSVK
jgi:hypothetical protein